MGRHFHIVNFALSRQLAETYISVFLRNFAVAMIGIFLPIYLFKELAYSFRTVLLFYIVLQSVACLSSPFIAKINAKHGCKHIILFSVPFTLIFYMALDILKEVSYIFWIIPILGGISESMYWIAFHVNFTKFTDNRHRGEEVSVWYVMTIVLGVIGPLIGALVLTFLSFNILFILVALLLLASALPLFSTEEVFSHSTFTIKSIFNSKRIKDGAAFVGYGARQMAGAVCWPFLIFFLVKSLYFNLGLVISVSSIFTALVAWLFVGRIVDKHSKRSFINWGTFIDSIVNVVRYFVNGFVQIIGLTVAGSVSYDLADIPFSAKTYNKAQVDTLGYMTYRSIFVNLGRILILIVPIIGSYFVDPLAPYEAFRITFVALVPFIFLQRLI